MTEIEEARKRLCENCVLYKQAWKCGGRLEPLTSTGEDCPYFKEK